MIPQGREWYELAEPTHFRPLPAGPEADNAKP